MAAIDAAQAVKPLATMPLAVRRSIRGVLADIDDTITTDGVLTPAAYAAIGRLHDAGMLVVPITGRPAGWCDHIARMWPVDGVVGENGAFYMRYDRAARKLVKRFVVDDETRTAHRLRLASVADRIVTAIGGAALASDQQYRESDIAIDFREDVPPLPPAEIDRIVAMMEAEGMSAKVSSIHVNGWFGAYDKLGMTATLFQEAFGLDVNAVKNDYVFVGDSPNDAPMFAFFRNSVGVANVTKLIDRIEWPPAFVTTAESGAGFVELADFLLAAR